MIALILVDIQKGLDEADHWGSSRNNPEAESKCQKILGYFRHKKLPLYHVQHCSKNPDSPLYPGKPGNDIKEIVAPQTGEVVLQKSTNSAFVGTELEQLLRDSNIDEIVVVGLTTDHCVSATVRNAADLGFRITLVSDATATYAKQGIDGTYFKPDLIHQISLASLNREFASITSTTDLIKELDASKIQGSE